MTPANEGPAETGDQYFLEVEAHFAFRRGTPVLFSGKDWLLMKEWHDGGVPLAIVIEAIDACFDAREKSGRKGKISGLGFCRHAVEEIWAERRNQMVGGMDAMPELDPAARLGELAAAVQGAAAAAAEAYRTAFWEAATAVAELATKPRSAPKIEERLIEIESRLIDALLVAMPAAERDALVSAVDAELARYAMPSEETRAKTRDANLRRRVRKALAVARLSLFG